MQYEYRPLSNLAPPCAALRLLLFWHLPGQRLRPWLLLVTALNLDRLWNQHITSVQGTEDTLALLFSPSRSKAPIWRVLLHSYDAHHAAYSTVLLASAWT